MNSEVWVSLISSVFLIWAGVPFADGDEITTMPNVVILYSDDAGYADFGFQPECADDIRHMTKNIDRIARHGVRLTNAYMSGCVCSPSRAGLMTGRYQGRFGYDNNLPPGTRSGLDLNEIFGAKRLRKLGYKTGLIGKWHLGYPPAFHPNRRGFDSFFGLLQGSRSYYPIDNVSPHRVILNNDLPTPEKGYVTDRFGDAAVKFIEAHHDQPFFLFVSFTAPHGPNQPNKKHVEKIQHIESKKRRNYVGLVVSLDENVGKILDALKDNQIDQNTLVIFTNDNGGQTKTGANNGPLKGRKGSLWEGGIRIPWTMQWPGKIAPESVCDIPIISLDILPSIVEAAGHKIPPEWNLDGQSFIPRITGDRTPRADRFLFWRHHGSKGNIAMRHGKWKLIHNRSESGSVPELYDLDKDKGEAKNIVKNHPEIAVKMLRELKNWENELQEPLWGPGAAKRKQND